MEPSIRLSFTTGRNHHHHRVHSSSTCLQRGVARANRHVLGKAKRGKRAKVTVSKPSTRQRSGSTLSQGIEPNSPAAMVLSWSERFRSVRDLRGGCGKPDTKEFETQGSRLMIPFVCFRDSMMVQDKWRFITANHSQDQESACYIGDNKKRRDGNTFKMLEVGRIKVRAGAYIVHEHAYIYPKHGDLHHQL